MIKTSMQHPSREEPDTAIALPILLAIAIHPIVVGHLVLTQVFGTDPFVGNGLIALPYVADGLFAATLIAWWSLQTRQSTTWSVVETQSGFQLDVPAPTRRERAFRPMVGTLVSMSIFPMIGLRFTAGLVGDELTNSLVAATLCLSIHLAVPLAMRLADWMGVRQNRASRIVLHGTVLRSDGATLMLNGDQRFERSAERLLVTCNDQRLLLNAPAPALYWMVERLGDLSTNGDSDDIPTELRTVTGQAKSASLKDALKS